jgi:hypothetical protein
MNKRTRVRSGVKKARTRNVRTERPVKVEIERVAKRTRTARRSMRSQSVHARVVRDMQRRDARDREALKLTKWQKTSNQASRPETLGDWLLYLFTGRDGSTDLESVVSWALYLVGRDMGALAKAELQNRSERRSELGAEPRDLYAQLVQLSARCEAASELLPRIVRANSPSDGVELLEVAP